MRRYSKPRSAVVVRLQKACSVHAIFMHMATLQVRNLSDDLHRELEARARRLGVSMSEYVTRVLRADLAIPEFDEWAAGVRRAADASGRRSIDVVGAVDAARDEYDPGHQDAASAPPAGELRAPASDSR